MARLIAGLAFCLLSLCALSAPQVNAQQGKNNTSNPERGASYRQGTSENQPVFVKVLPPIPDPREDERRAAEDKEKADKIKIDHGMLHYTGELADYTKYLYWATAALFAVTACLFAVAGAQLRDSRRAVAAAVRSTAIAEKALLVSQKTSQQQLRAYVFALADGPLKLDETGCITAALKLTNFGQTPGQEVQSKTHMILDDLATPEFQWLEMPFGSKSPLAPTESFELKIKFDHKLDQNQRLALTHRQAAIYVRVEVLYLDVFEKAHRTECLLYCTGPDASIGALAVYETGNSAD